VPTDPSQMSNVKRLSLPRSRTLCPDLSRLYLHSFSGSLRCCRCVRLVKMQIPIASLSMRVRMNSSRGTKSLSDARIGKEERDCTICPSHGQKRAPFGKRTRMYTEVHCAGGEKGKLRQPRGGEKKQGKGRERGASPCRIHILFVEQTGPILLPGRFGNFGASRDSPRLERPLPPPTHTPRPATMSTGQKLN
jgi:hypothetical protein